MRGHIKILAFILFTVFQVALNSSITWAQSDDLHQVLSEGWFFHKGPESDAEANNHNIQHWQSISVPHTWNLPDGQDGNAEGYYRGVGWYRRPLEIPEEWQGKRIYLRFEAVSTVADVYVNGVHAGQHLGGFTAFAFDITPQLKFGKANTISVKADNTHFDHISPLSGDFVLFGGIYRPVHLLVKDPVSITLLDHGGPGIYISTKLSKENNSAEIAVRTVVRNASDKPRNISVTTEVLDADKRVVATERQQVNIESQQEQSVLANIFISEPHLWSGLRDPYLYSARIKISAGEFRDKKTQPFGIRSIAFHKTKGLLLNGQPIRIHGVNHHQDLYDKGWALSREDHQQNAAFVREIGANGVRLAHYPHADYVYDLYDQGGQLIWAEIPLVNAVKDTPEFTGMNERQLREFIRQNYNHPSIFVWGLWNELMHRPSDNPVPLVTRLAAIAEQEDPGRPVIAAANGSHKKSPGLVKLTSLKALNTYPGWYKGSFGDFTDNIKRKQIEMDAPMLSISEYGGGASIYQHDDDPQNIEPGGYWHPEEYQARLHEGLYEQIRNNPTIWSSFVWNLFDFASARRDEGDAPGINDKGLVTYDRRVKKDAFYFYKAHWNTEPLVHITSRRYAIRKRRDITVRVYSNLPNVKLLVNGENLGTAAEVESDVIHIWRNVRLKPNENKVEAVAINGNGTEITDDTIWRYKRILEKRI